VTLPAHPTACEAAVAVRVVRGQRGDAAAEALSQWAYGLNQKLTVKALEDALARMNVLDVYRHNYQAVADQVARDARLGKQMGVYATPTVFLGDIKLPSVGPRSIEALLKAESERAKNSRVRQFTQAAPE
jgi:protein-disulfide isomerase